MEDSESNNDSSISAGKLKKVTLSVVGGSDFEAGIESITSRSYHPDAEQSPEVNMSDISRSELQALLKANKAEVDAVASAMKTEMANWREQMKADLRDVKNAVDRQTDKLESNFSAQQTKLDSAIQIQTIKLEKTVSDTRLDIIKWVLGVPALAFTLWKIYESIH